MKIRLTNETDTIRSGRKSSKNTAKPGRHKNKGNYRSKYSPFVRLIATAIILFMILGTVISLVGCTAFSGNMYIERSGFYFNTIVNVRIYDCNDEEILNECMEICGDMENLLDPDLEGSDVYNINHSEGAVTKVTKDTIDLLDTALKYNELSGGALNPALGSVIELWDFTSDRDKIIPSGDALKKALEHTDPSCISINKGRSTVTVSDPSCHIALGAVAKGMIADKLKAHLLEKGIQSAIINLGGNVLLIGSKPNGKDFGVGIQKPFGDSGSFSEIVNTSDKSIVTSGVYERYFEKDGLIYHHILSPDNGFPVSNGLYSVTILSDKSIDGDALSTACFVMGPDEGMKLIESLDGIEAMFIDSDQKISYSSGFPGSYIDQ